MSTNKIHILMWFSLKKRHKLCFSFTGFSCGALHSTLISYQDALIKSWKGISFNRVLFLTFFVSALSGTSSSNATAAQDDATSEIK